MDGEGLVEAGRAAVGNAHGDRVAGLGLEVEHAVVDDQLVAVAAADAEGTKITGSHDAVAGGITGIHITSGEGADGEAATGVGVLIDAAVAQGDVGWCLVEIIHADGEGLFEAGRAAVGNAHGNRVAGLGFKVEHAVVDDQLIAVAAADAEGAKVTGSHDAVAGGIAGIHIAAGEGADGEAAAGVGVLIDAAVAQADVGRRIVGVADRKGKALGLAEAAVGDGDHHAVIADIGVKRGAGKGGRAIVVVDQAQPGRHGRGAEAQGVAVGVTGAEGVAVGRVFAGAGLRCRVEAWGGVDVDRQGLVKSQAAAVGDAHRHLVAGLAGVIQSACTQHQLRVVGTGERECGGIRTADNAEAGTVAGVLIAGRKRTHGEAAAGVGAFVDPRIAQRDVAGCLVGIGDRDGDHFAVTGAACVGDLHGDVVRGGRFIVQQSGICHRDLAAVGVDREAAAGIVGQAQGLCAEHGLGIEFDHVGVQLAGAGIVPLAVAEKHLGVAFAAEKIVRLAGNPVGVVAGCERTAAGAVPEVFAVVAAGEPMPLVVGGLICRADPAVVRGGGDQRVHQVVFIG